MSKYHFCIDCEQIKTRMVSGLHGAMVKELSCPARFNPMEGKWNPKEGMNPHECPRNEKFMRVQHQNGDIKNLCKGETFFIR
jgi:hypothetical protein